MVVVPAALHAFWAHPLLAVASHVEEALVAVEVLASVLDQVARVALPFVFFSQHMFTRFILLPFFKASQILEIVNLASKTPNE